MTGSLVILGTIPGNLAECEELETQVRSIYQRLKDAEEIIAPLSEKLLHGKGKARISSSLHIMLRSMPGRIQLTVLTKP